MADNNVQNPPAAPAQPQAPQQVNTPAQPATIDYDKLASIINGKQAVTEDTILKNYFKNQGLSQTDAEAAIAAFKAEKAKNTPDVAAIQQQLATANQQLMTAHIEQQATMEALGLGISPAMISYVIKLADMTAAVGADGKINAEEIKKAISKVVEDVPAFKATQAPQQDNNVQGGFSVGGGGGASAGATQDDMLRWTMLQEWCIVQLTGNVYLNGEMYNLQQEYMSFRMAQEGNKDCLSCANSCSKLCEDGDILHCMERDGEIIEDNGYCHKWN